MHAPAPGPVPALLLALGRRKAHGVLVAASAAGERRVYLLGGRVLAVEGGTTDDAFAALLGRAEIPIEGGDHSVDERVESLLAAGHPAARLDALRREHMRALLVEVLAATDARFLPAEAEPGPVDDALFPGLDPLAVLAGLTAAPASAAHPPVPAAAVDCEPLSRRLASASTDTWYDLLGVRPSVSPSGLAQAEAALRADLAPIVSGGPPAAQSDAALLLAAAGIAVARLRDDASRAAYDQLLARGTAPPVASLLDDARAEAGPAVPAPPLQSGPPGAAGEALQAARAALEAGDAAAALLPIERAFFLAPDSPDVLAERAWVLHLTREHTTGAEAPAALVARALALAPGHPRAEEVRARMAEAPPPKRKGGWLSWLKGER
jgi:hypothetical protein